MDPARLSAGAVYLELDPRGELADYQQHAATAGGLFSFVVLILLWAGYSVVRRQVVAPTRALQQVVERRQSGASAAYAPEGSDDELGKLARALNHLLDAQDERAALYQQMFSEHPAVQILVDPASQRIIDANAAASAFYGHPLASLRDCPLATISTRSPTELADLFTEIMNHEHMVDTAVHRLASGEQRTVRIHSGPIRVEDRLYLLAVIHDITEEQRNREQLETYREVFNSLPVGVYRNTPGSEGYFLEANPAMAAIFEADSVAELLEHPVAELYERPGERASFSFELDQLGTINRRELRLRTLQGHTIWAAITAHKHVNSNDQTVFDGVVEDITERKGLEAARDRLITILEATPDFIAMADMRGRLLYLNRGARELLGLPPSQTRLKNDIPPSLQGEVGLCCFAAPEWAAHKIRGEALPTVYEHGIWEGETALVDRDGEEVPVLQVIVAHHDSAGQVERLTTLMRSISDRKRLEAELEHRASHDALTSAFNRGKLESFLQHEAQRAERFGSSLALILFDVDFFKQVNDTYGHDVGDAILVRLVQLVSHRLRRSDLLARWGGEEFMVLLPETDADGAQQVAENLRAAVADTDFEGPGTLTVSAGVTAYRPGEPLKTFIKRVDDALYAAKAAGRNTVVRDGGE
jgi:diguanylate cyclase (GGDEF)-like protein/PAS domain S-box-containing protein